MHAPHNRYRAALLLGLAFTAMAASSVLAGVLALAQQQAGIDRLREIVMVGSTEMARAETLSESVGIELRALQVMLLLDDPELLASEVQKIDRARTAYSDAWQALPQSDPSEATKPLHAAIEAARATTIPIYNRIKDLALADQRAEAATLLFDNGTPKAHAWQDAIEASLDLAKRENRDRFAASRAESERSTLMLRAGACLALAMSAVLALFVARIIVRSLVLNRKNVVS